MIRKYKNRRGYWLGREILSSFKDGGASSDCGAPSQSVWICGEFMWSDSGIVTFFVDCSFVEKEPNLKTRCGICFAVQLLYVTYGA